MKRFAKHAKPLFTRLTQLKHNYTTPVEPLPESKINYWNPSSLIKRLSSLEPFAPQENLQVKFPLQDSDYIAYRIYRYDPTKDEAPYIQTWFMQKKDQQPMLLSNLFYLKDNEDESLAFRRSCREGICGSCAMNIDGKNRLACLTVMDHIVSYTKPYVDVYPLPHMPVVKDLVVDMKHFYQQYSSISPYLKHREPQACVKPIIESLNDDVLSNLRITVSPPSKEIYQSKADRKLIDGLYECILCACCSTSCPSYWWNREKYLGPAVLLQAFRWIIDSRDDFTEDRLKYLNDAFKLYRCHTILNCVKACPKGLNPAEAISNIKDMIHIMEEME